MKILILSLLFSLCANATPELTDEQFLNDTIDSWYSSIFKNGEVRKKDFETAVKGWFYYKKNEKIPGHNLMAIANYSTKSDNKRFYIFQIGPNPKMVREEWVAHGKNSGPGWSPAELFSNTNQSYKSSRGFLKTGGTGTGDTVGPYRALIGLEPGVNGQVQNREILIHKSKNVGAGLAGTSLGCLSLDPERYVPVKNLLIPGTLIYSADGKDHDYYPFLGGSGHVTSADINGVPGTNYDPGPETDPNYTGFDQISELNDVPDPSGPIDFAGGGFSDLGTDAAIPAVTEMKDYDPEKDENNENTFSEELSKSCFAKEAEDCKNRSSVPWSQVVAEAKKPNGEPAKYFIGTYKALEKHLEEQPMATDALAKSKGIANYNSNKQCLALARMSQYTDFDMEGLEEPKEVCSKDNTVCCKYKCSQAQDYNKCLEGVKALDLSLEGEAAQKETQAKDYKEITSKQAEEVKKNQNNLQFGVATVQKNATTLKANMAAERSEFQMAKVRELNSIQAAMPNRNSILNDCRSYVAGRDMGKKHLKLYLNHLVDITDKSIPPTPNPCDSVAKLMRTNLVQNIAARKQIISVVEKAGLKALSLDDKQRRFLNQSSLIGNGALRNRKGGVDYGQIGKFVGQKDRGSSEIKNRMGYGNVADCKGANCRVSGGNGLKLDSNRSKKNSINTNFASYGGSNFGGANGSAVGANKVLTFEGKKNDRGVFDEDFYVNVNLALAGQFPVDKLSAAQKKEYDAVLEFNHMSERQKLANRKGSQKAVKIGPKGLGREIWFDKSMDLFKIISNRYKEAVKDNRL